MRFSDLHIKERGEPEKCFTSPRKIEIKSPSRRQSAVSITVSVTENENKQKEVVVDQDFGDRSTRSRYLISDRYVEKIVDNFHSNHEQI